MMGAKPFPNGAGYLLFEERARCIVERFLREELYCIFPLNFHIHRESFGML